MTSQVESDNVGDAAPRLQLPLTCDPPGDDNPPQTAVWIVFGATGHMGRSLVSSALGHGDKVTAVGWAMENTKEQVTGWHENCLGLVCDVRLRDTVETVINESISHWGRVDVIANCTGYGVIAAAEDQSEQDLQNQFNTNFIGTLNIIQLSLPYFRRNEIPGRYLIFSSTAGALGVPGMSAYCATKYAVEGLVESMLYEVHCFGIKLTLVEPGYVRDDDSDSSSILETRALAIQQRPQVRAPRIKRYGHFNVKAQPSAPYAAANSPSGHARRVFQWLGMKQPTSAVRSAELIWQLAHCSYPPLRLLLGNYAVESIRDRLRCVTEEIEDWKFLSFSGTEEGGGSGGQEGEGGMTRERSQGSTERQTGGAAAADEERYSSEDG